MSIGAVTARVRAVLAANSAYFESIFRSHKPAPGLRMEIAISGCSADTFKLVIDVRRGAAPPARGE